jgi:hypothetical protein
MQDAGESPIQIGDAITPCVAGGDERLSGMNYDLGRFDMAAVSQCADALKEAAVKVTSLEGAGSAICEFLYRGFAEASGARSCALVRCYKSHSYGALPPDLQRFARRAYGAVAFSPPEPEMKCLTLLGTAGDQPEWNHRNQSQGHQAIPLPTPQIVAKAPMIAQLIRELGFDIAQVIRPGPGVVRDLAGRSYGVFFVPEAAGSPFIPAQESFVKPYGIRSVVGFGGALPNGELMAIILFCKIRVEAGVADRFRTLAHEVIQGLATFPADRTFDRAGSTAP